MSETDFDRLLDRLDLAARRVVIEQVSAAQLRHGRKHRQFVPAVPLPSAEERADDLLWRAGRRICHRTLALAYGPDESRRLPDIPKHAALARNWKAPWREPRKHIGSKGGYTIDVKESAPSKPAIITVDDLLDEPEVEVARLFEDEKDDGADVEVLGYDWGIGFFDRRPAPHPRPLYYKDIGRRYTQVRCCECSNHDEIEPRPKQEKGKPKKCQVIGIAFGNDKAGYGPKQETKPTWKRLPPRWVPWIETATRAIEKAHPEPKKKKGKDSDYAPIDMEPSRGEFWVATDADDEGGRRDMTGYQIEKDGKAERWRRPLRRKEDDHRSRATVREQAKRDPVLLVRALTADPRAKCSKLFKGDAFMARAGLYEYALLPDDHRNWKDRMLDLYDPARGMPPSEFRRPPETTAPPVMYSHSSFLPAWNDGPAEFKIVEGAVDGQFDIFEREPKRPFGDDALQGYTRKKANISGAVAIAMKGEELPDEEMLAVVDIGGGLRIGLRKTELTKPEIVVGVKPFDAEVLPERLIPLLPVRSTFGR